LDLQIGGEMQQLRARKLLTHYDFAQRAKANEMKDCLAKVNADRV
jgi:hypothetical protein